MAKQRKKCKKANKGYTLIELIVTILISACVVASAAGFLSLGLRQYQLIEEETILQRESQITELFLTELFQEAADFEIISAGYPTGSGMTKAIAVERDGTEYLVAHAGNELWYGEAGAGTREEQLAALVSTPKSEKFLSEYVTLFELYGAGTTFEEIAEGDGWVNIKVKYAMTEKTYTSNMVVALRNTKRN